MTTGTVAAVLGVVGLTLCAPTSAGAQTHPSAIKACEVLKQSGAKRVFGSSTMSSESGPSLPNGHSECLFTPDSSNKASLVVDVSWNKKTLSVYRLVYGGHAVSVPVTTPTGRATGTTIRAPHFSRVTVAGESDYWLANPPSVGADDFPATYNPNMISEKGGYVVGLHSLYLSKNQDKAAMTAILNRL
jgi:hypothetical protein